MILQTIRLLSGEQSCPQFAKVIIVIPLQGSMEDRAAHRLSAFSKVYFWDTSMAADGPLTPLSQKMDPVKSMRTETVQRWIPTGILKYQPNENIAHVDFRLWKLEQR